MSRDFGAAIIRINLRESQVPSSKNVGLPLGALAGLKCIDEVFNCSDS
jgi:hypothetical protein